MSYDGLYYCNFLFLCRQLGSAGLCLSFELNDRTLRLAFFEYGFIMSFNAFGFSMRYHSDCDIADTSNDIDELNNMDAFSSIFRGFSVHKRVHRPSFANYSYSLIHITS